jgi:hypothetical protein
MHKTTGAIIVVLLGCFFSPAIAERPFKPALSFPKAADPFTKAKYNKDGYVDKSGRIRNGGLGCSAYTSVVLHRMRHGKGWQKPYSLKVHQWYGDRIAKHFGLKQAGRFSAKTLLNGASTKQLVATGKLKANILYVFNVRKGKQGHVGFVRVKADGKMIQSHYSGLPRYQGLATGDFRIWLRASQYRIANVELFAVPE